MRPSWATHQTIVGEISLGAISEALTYLKGSRESVELQVSRFPEMDVDQLARDLNLVALGRQNGVENVPDSDSNTPTAAELAIVADINGRARRAQGDFHSALDLYESRIRDCAVDHHAHVLIKAAGEDGRSNFKAQAVEDRSMLFVSRDRASGIRSELTHFRNINKLLSRQPKVVATSSKVISWLFLALLFLIETTFNGFFFAEGSTAGLIGGFAQAMTLAFLNIFVAGCLGLGGLRYAQHANAMKKYSAWAFCILCLIGAMFLNLFIAHFRDAFVATQGHVSAVELQHALLTSPLSLAEAQSWILFGLGLALHLIAVWKFYSMTDPYPGYEEVGRRWQMTIDEYASETKRCLQVLADHRADAIEGMKQIIVEIQRKKYELETALRGRERMRRDFDAFVVHLNTTSQRLTAVYRDAHLGVRTVAAPAYFSRPLHFDLPEPHPFSPTTIESTAPHERAAQTMSDYIDLISSDYEQVLSEYPKVETLSEDWIANA